MKRKGEGIMRITKIVSSVLAGALAVSAAVPVFAAKTAFTDISGEQYSWCKTQIQNMADKGLISGYEDQTYRPDNEVTRLECLALFARAMGSADSANAEILKTAHEMYDETITPYGLSWGTDEIAYLLYKGALKKTDLDTYLKNDEKSKPMKRYEAAMIITKSMGGEKKALADSKADTGYSDNDKIPSGAVGYVKYAGDAEIMNGMEDNNFSPLTSVLRSQIAVMLSRVVDKMQYEFVLGKLVSLDTDSRTFVVKDKSGNSSTEVYTDDTVMNVVGVRTIPAKMLTGVSAIFTYSGSSVIAIDVISSVPDETIRGKYVSSGTATGTMFVTIKPSDGSGQKSYDCADDVTILFDGSPATMRSFTLDDPIELSLVNGKVETISAVKKSSTISGAVVKSISIDPKLTMTISHADEDYDGKTYTVSNSVTVKKNGQKSDFASIYEGDSVTLTLEYDEIVKVDATAKKTKSTGTIKSLTIASQPTMVVSINGTEKEFMIPSSVEIDINGKTGTLYDFRVGDEVTITIESDAITAISAKSTQVTAGSVVGVVTAINASYGFITVKPDGGEAQTVFCKDDKTTFITSAGKSLKMSGISEGDTVDVRGSVSNGAFVATLVIVTPDN